MTRMIIAFARVDTRNALRDSLLAVLLASPILLALALRVGYAPAAGWLLSAHGLDLDAYLAPLLGFIVILHVPLIFGMVGALLVLDDADDRTLLALRVTPVTLKRYLGYRVVVIAAASFVGLMLAAPLSGLVEPGSLAALLPCLALAAACAPLITLATVSLASNKVEGLVVLKALGIPFYLPLASWFAKPPWDGVLAVLPTYWPARALWAGLEGRIDAVALLAGTPIILSMGWLLARRTLRRATSRL